MVIQLYKSKDGEDPVNVTVVSVSMLKQTHYSTDSPTNQSKEKVYNSKNLCMLRNTMCTYGSALWRTWRDWFSIHVKRYSSLSPPIPENWLKVRVSVSRVQTGLKRNKQSGFLELWIIQTWMSELDDLMWEFCKANCGHCKIDLIMVSLLEISEYYFNVLFTWGNTLLFRRKAG